MKATVGLSALFLSVVACSVGDARTEEVWAIDFQSYQIEVATTLAQVELDQRDIEQRVLEHLGALFHGLPIRFELGTAIGSRTMSSICVRHGDEGKIGRGVLDVGNDGAVHDCGEPDGSEHGVFINRLAGVYFAEIEGETDPSIRADAFAKLLAVVLAHEIGHGIGLTHSEDEWGRGDVMKAFPIFDRDQDYYFHPGHYAQLAGSIVARR